MPPPPFTAGEFFDVFVRYNRTFGFGAIVLTTLALLLVAAIVQERPARNRIATQGLALLWFWSGLGYHVMHFARINRVAWGFGAMFVAQAWWFLRSGQPGSVSRLQFGPPAGGRGWLGGAIMAYALFGYPLVALKVGHAWPQMPTFGVPCPVVIFTLGLLLWAEEPFPRRLLVVPLLWAGIGSLATLAFGVYEDAGLVVAAAIAWGALPGRRGHVPAPHRSKQLHPFLGRPRP